MFSRIPTGDILFDTEKGAMRADPSHETERNLSAVHGGGHAAAILPRAKADREKLRRTLMKEFRRQLPAMLESSGEDGPLPERSLNVIRMLTRLEDM